MKILLDENLPHELRSKLPGHDVFTIQYQGWSGVKNGLLLAQAAASGFDVMITMDSGVTYQQNTAVLPLAVVVLRAASNDMDDLEQLIKPLLASLLTLKPKTIVWVGH